MSSFLTGVVGFAWFDPQDHRFIQTEHRRLANWRPPKTITQIWCLIIDISTYVKAGRIYAEDRVCPDHRGIEWEPLKESVFFCERLVLVCVKLRFGGPINYYDAAREKSLPLPPDRSYIRKAQR